MNFQFDLKTTYRKGLDMVPVYFEHLKTVAYFTTAFVYVAGKRAGEYYFANQEEIHLHLALFVEVAEIVGHQIRITAPLVRSKQLTTSLMRPSASA